MRAPLLVLAFGMATALAVAAIGCSSNDSEDLRPEIVTIGGTDGRVGDFEFQPRRWFLLWDPDTTDAITQTGDHVSPEDLAVFVNRNDNLADRQSGAEVIDSARVSVSGDPDAAFLSEQFVRLTVNDDYYFLIYSQVMPGPVLELRTPLSPDWTLAVSYIVRNGSGTPTDTVGNYLDTGRPPNHPVWLKMLHAPISEQPANLLEGRWAPTRRLELRNIYDLGVTQIDPESFRLSIYRADTHDSVLDGVSCLEALGLDIINNETQLGREDPQPGSKGPDGRVDPYYVDYENGLLFFPDLRPFDPGPIDLNGNDPDNPLDGERPPSRRPRERALGYYRILINPGAGPPLYGYRYERVPPAQARAETNSAIYDSRDQRPDSQKYFVTGWFLRHPAAGSGIAGAFRRIF